MVSFILYSSCPKIILLTVSYILLRTLLKLKELAEIRKEKERGIICATYSHWYFYAQEY